MGFDRIGHTTYTTDAGWGCMLRASQMLLANTLARYDCVCDLVFMNDRERGCERAFVSNNRHFGGSQPEQALGDVMQRRLLRMFEDRESSGAPFSIHNVAESGARRGTPIGAWFGPQAACDTLRDLVEREQQLAMSVYVARDATLYRHELLELCRARDTDALLLLVPNRLGLERLNALYAAPLWRALTLPHSLGVVGGRANAARYYVGGIDGERLLYLDPHSVQTRVDMSRDDAFAIDSYHVRASPSHMPLLDVDPSLALAFYCANAADLHALLDSLTEQCMCIVVCLFCVL
jgi:cysteine protease ATG4